MTKRLLFAALTAFFASCSFIGRSCLQEAEPVHPAEDQPASYELHTVKKGETLYGLSRKYGVPLEQIAELNGIEDASRIAAGAELKIPGISKKKKQTVPVPVPGNTNGENSPGGTFLESWPLETAARDKVVRKFGRIYDPVLQVFTNNNGIDINAGDSAVLAVAEGEIAYFDFIKGLGTVIGIKLKDEYYAFYSPLYKIDVSKDQKVKKGSLLGYAQSGILHFEIRKGSSPLNPLLFLP